MNVGLYSSVKGKMETDQMMDVIARNLANVNTTGFKKNMISFSSAAEGSSGVPSGISKMELLIDHSQGSLKPTGNKLDLGIHGKGFFTMGTSKGENRFTRNGHFLLNSDMEVVNDVGWKLKGSGGAVTLPKGTKDITVESDGSVLADGVKIGSVKITYFKNEKDLKEVGNSSFESESGSNGEDSTDFNIQQGFLENSNVEIIGEMVALIANSQSSQGNNTITKRIDDSLDKLIRTASTVN